LVHTPARTAALLSEATACIRDVSDGLWPTTAVGLSDDLIAGRGIGKPRPARRLTSSENGPVTASRHHNAKAYQKVKARAKARTGIKNTATAFGLLLDAAEEMMRRSQ